MCPLPDTLDVLIAVFVCIVIWNIYHEIAMTDEIRHKFPLLDWLEATHVLHVDMKGYAGASRKQPRPHDE